MLKGPPKAGKIVDKNPETIKKAIARHTPQCYIPPNIDKASGARKSSRLLLKGQDYFQKRPPNNESGWFSGHLGDMVQNPRESAIPLISWFYAIIIWF